MKTAPRIPQTLAVFHLVLLAMAGCQQAPIPTHQIVSGRTMGTSYSVTLVPWPDMPPLTQFAQRIDEELKLVNDQMSTYIDSSELSQFNNQQTTEWFDVSADTAVVVQLAQQVSQWTDGAFDVTVGPLVDLWGFGPAGRPESVPSESAIAEVLSNVGFDKVEVRQTPPAIRKTVPQLRMDLSAIAKGHGVDRVARVLDEMGCENYFVEIGGEVRTRGHRQDGRAWQVGIERPNENAREIEAVIGLSDMSLATSGDYRNVYEIEGQRLSHFIDPKTGHPTVGEIVSASVIAENCALADALATALMSAGFEKGLQLADTNDWAVMLIARRDGKLENAASPRYQALTTDPNSTRKETQP